MRIPPARPYPQQVTAVLIPLLLSLSLTSSASAAEPTNALLELQKQYAPINSVYLKATARIEILRPPKWGEEEGTEINGYGSFEYRADGPLYRVSATTSSALGLAMDYEIAFNGSDFQLLMMDASVLSLSQHDLRQLPLALPNPFFLPLNFLSEDNDDCPICRLKFSHLKDHSLWEEKLRSASADLSVKDSGNAPVLLIPGGSTGGEPFTHQLHFSEEGKTLRRIDRLTAEGRVMAQIELKSYQALQHTNGASNIPTNIVVTVYNYKGGNEVIMKSTFTITEIEINPHLTLSDFTLSRETPETVYDSDSETFLKKTPKQP